MKPWHAKYNKPEVSQQQEHTFHSEMTSQQKFQSVTHSVLATMGKKRQEAKGCSMHPKISKKCRKCQQIQSTTPQPPPPEELDLNESPPQVLKLNTHNPKFHFNQKLSQNIQSTAFYKSQLKVIYSIKQVLSKLTSEQILIDAYRPSSTDAPTEFIMFFFRIVQLRPTREQLIIMLRSNNVNVRCLGMLFIRVCADFMEIYGWLCKWFGENRVLFATMTIGEYALRLLDEEQLNHGGFRLPRIPVRIQKEINRRVDIYKQRKDKEERQQYERQRQRSRQFNKKVQQTNRFNRQRQPPSSSQNQQQKQQLKIEQKTEPILSLKEKIKRIEQDKQKERKKNKILEQYKSQNVDNLGSEQEDFEESGEIQKYNVG